LWLPGVQEHLRRLEAELEQLHDCCVDLTNRLNAAEARETDLASELARREDEVEAMALELGKREDEVEAMASEVVRKDEEMARMAAELGRRQAGGGMASPAVGVPETRVGSSPVPHQVDEGTNPDHGFVASMEGLAEQRAAELDQQKTTISELQVECFLNQCRQ
jgi:hypothetical protein